MDKKVILEDAIDSNPRGGFFYIMTLKNIY